jgi:hypothetical protein
VRHRSAERTTGERVISFFDDFTGASSQRDLRRGRDAQLNALMAGETEAGGYLDRSHTDARGLLDPFIASGRGYQSMYDDLMGLNGPEARARAQETISSDPMWQGQLGLAQNAAQRALNARGMGGSGTAALAGQRVLAENWGNVLGRYQQGGQQGMTAAGAGADLTSRYGSDRAGLTFGAAQQRAGVEGSFANSMAANRGTLMNNILGVGSLAVSAATGMPTNKMFGAGARPQQSVLPGGVGAQPY